MSSGKFPNFRKFQTYYSFFLQYNWLQLDKTKNKLKMFYKEITKQETRKYSTTHISLLSQIEQWKRGEGVDARGKILFIYLKPKKESKDAISEQ